MTSRLRRAFIDNLKSTNWMDYGTRQYAKEKVQRSQNIIQQIRRPSHMFDHLQYLLS